MLVTMKVGVITSTFGLLIYFTSKTSAFKFFSSDVEVLPASHSKLQEFTKNIDGSMKERRIIADNLSDDYGSNFLATYVPPGPSPSSNSTENPTLNSPTDISSDFTRPTSKPTPMPSPKPPTTSSTGLFKESALLPSSKPHTKSNPTIKPWPIPSSKPTLSNIRFVADNLAQTLSPESQGYNEAEIAAANQGSTVEHKNAVALRSFPLPLFITTIGVVLICLLGIGVGYTAWMMGGPEEEWSTRSQEHHHRSSTFPWARSSPFSREREVTPSRTGDCMPSPTREVFVPYENTPRRKKRGKRKNMAPVSHNKNKEIIATTPSSWFDRFLDNTINIVCS